MSVVSAGGRRGPSKEHHHRAPPPARGDIRSLKVRPGRGYSQSEVGVSEPFLVPRFSAVASENRTIMREYKAITGYCSIRWAVGSYSWTWNTVLRAGDTNGVKVQMPMDDWGENTTVLTGVTSEHSYNGDEKKVYDPPIGRVVSRRCSRIMWLLIASIVFLLALLSAPLMCAMPFLLRLSGFDYPVMTCEVDCQGKLLVVAIESVFLFVATWALYVRRAAADLPRLYFERVAITLSVVFILFAFWLFYIVRIILEKEQNYESIVSFSLYPLNALLFTHYISLIVLYVRKSRREFTITIVRDPDGESYTMSIGLTSLQEAAIDVLKFYQTKFSSFNHYLDKAKNAPRGNQGIAQMAGFKMYDIEGLGGGENISEVNARALVEAAARRRISGYNEILQDEMEWEKRIKKRKYRLMAATEDAFAHVQGISDNGASQKQQALGDPMDSLTAAKNVYTWIMRPLTKYLKLTRQHEKHPAEAVTQHIERCLSMKLSHRTFLQRFFDSRFPQRDIVAESKWSIISDEQASVAIQHGTTFVLRSHNKDDDAGVQLLCTVSSYPFFNLTEQPRSSISKFALRISSESSV